MLGIWDLIRTIDDLTFEPALPLLRKCVRVIHRRLVARLDSHVLLAPE